MKIMILKQVTTTQQFIYTVFTMLLTITYQSRRYTEAIGTFQESHRTLAEFWKKVKTVNLKSKS